MLLNVKVWPWNGESRNCFSSSLMAEKITRHIPLKALCHAGFSQNNACFRRWCWSHIQVCARARSPINCAHLFGIVSPNIQRCGNGCYSEGGVPCVTPRHLMGLRLQPPYGEAVPCVTPVTPLISGTHLRTSLAPPPIRLAARLRQHFS